MRLRTDDRAVTVQIGTVLLFAVLIVLLSTYQATVVPQQNERVEFDHNQQVHGQMQDLRDELHRTGATGSGGSASVALGAQFPVRAFFVNPPSPSGTLRTTDAANVTIENATASGELHDYWDGDEQSFSTRGLVYEPNYHEYQRPPTTVYRNDVLYNRFDGETNITLAGQRLVRDDRLSLISLDGNLSASSSSAASVDAHPISPATRTVTVRNESPTANITIVVPTTLPKENATGLWRELLEDEERVRSVTPGDRNDTVRIELEPGTYRLKMAKVGVATDATDVSPHYVTVVEGDDESVSAGGKRKVVAEVRDRFNNPVAGATVNVSDVSDGSVTPEPPGEVETDEDGRATFVYHADGLDDNDEEVNVTVEIGDGPEDREQATATLYVGASGGGDGGDGESGVYDLSWDDPTETNTDESLSDCDDDYCEWDAEADGELDLPAYTDPALSDLDVEFALDGDAGTLETTDHETGEDGRTGTTLVAESEGEVDVYAISGDASDVITVNVTNVGDGGADPPKPTVKFRVDDLSHVNENRLRYVASYDVSNTNESFQRVSVRYDRLSGPSASGVNNSTAARGNLEYGLGYATGDEWNITVRVVYENDAGEEYVAARKSIVDTADALNPDENDDLTGTGSPTVDSFDVSDQSSSSQGVRYHIDYGITTNGDFSRVEGAAISLGGGGADTAVNSNPSDRIDLNPGYSRGGQFRVKLLVFDSDGAVVAVEAETDTAN